MIEPASNRIESAVESAELVDFESAEVESVEFAEAVSESAVAAVDFEALLRRIPGTAIQTLEH